MYYNSILQSFQHSEKEIFKYLLLFDKVSYLTLYLNKIGISSLYTITGMAIVRYLSVVRLERSWHIHNTNINFWTSPCIWIAWLMGIVFAFPPLIGLGDFKLDTSKIW